MKLLSKLTKKDLATKSHEELFSLAMEEIRCTDKETLIEILSKTREKSIKDQKQTIIKDMEDEVIKQLELIRVIKSKRSTEDEKDLALDKVIRFFELHDVVLSKELLHETYGLFVYIIKKGDARSARELEVLMIARTKMVKSLGLEMFSSIILRHSRIVEEMITIDAKRGLDFIYRQHIKSAAAGEYGPVAKKHEDTAEYKRYLMEIYDYYSKTEASV